MEGIILLEECQVTLLPFEDLDPQETRARMILQEEDNTIDLLHMEPKDGEDSEVSSDEVYENHCPVFCRYSLI